MVRFHALGGPSVTDADGEAVGIGGPRQRRLLAVLLIHRNRVVSVDRLAEAVFAGAPTPSAATTLRSYVARVRKALDAADAGGGPGAVVVTRAPGYLLQVADEAFDVACFERLLADADARLARDDAAGASAVVREGLALWQGDAYAEFADEEWAMPEAQRLGELRLVAEERRIDAELACGQAAEVVPVAASLARDHPTREAFRAQLMLALYRTGRQADALEVFREYRETLVAELGVDPTPRLAELHERILGHDPRLLLSEPAGRALRGYRLGERLGTGRDGTVCAASLPGVERDVVVRVYREDVADRPGFVREFGASAHRLASLHHPAVVAVHDHWREPGTACLVMRRMYGGSLADRLRQGPLSAAATALLVDRVGGALVAAAEQGVAHGRVVAESVLYDEAGDPFLSDFALGADEPPPTSGGDVHDLAELVARCLPAAEDAVVDVLDRGRATHGRPPIADFVPRLVAALAGVEPTAPAAVPNPYRGLRAFDEGDAADFFGRGDLVGAMLDRLGTEELAGRLLLVVGGSGTGKSSAVQAGLLPRVRRGDGPGAGQWFVTTMQPGAEPFKELAEGLRRVAVAEPVGLAEQLAAEGGVDRVLRRVVPADGQLLLVVDQFEELFTLAGAADRRAFLDGILDAVTAADGRLRVVATLRADFYDRPLAVPGFGAVVQGATVAIPAMSPAELEEAIVGPADRVGGGVEPALVAELVSAVADQPAALPSLQFTLYELAERCPDLHLTLAAYRDLGGVSGAIAARAEALYVGLDGTERAGVRRMFERLVVVGAEGEPTRRRAPRTELSADAVVEPWAQARLLTLDRDPHSRVPTVELAHEAMLRVWPRLRGWIEADREELLVRGQLRDAARTWDRLDRDPSGLYRGARLQVALDITTGEDLSDLEQGFLAAGVEERDREQREAEEVATRQARANRRLRRQLGVIAVAFVVALVGAVVAVDQRSDAQDERSRRVDAVEAERRLAFARELATAATASLDEDPERSILLALAAVDETRTVDGTVLQDAEEALHRAVTATRIVLRVSQVGGKLDWSPDGATFVTEGEEESGVVDIRDARNGRSLLAFRGHDADINDVAYSPDGTRLATTGDDGAIRVWDPATGTLLAAHQAGSGPVITPSFSPDGTRVVAAWQEQQVVRVIDLQREKQVLEVPGAGGSSFSPDGERIAYTSRDPGVDTVADARTGEVIFTVRHEAEITAAAWSTDGRRYATAAADGLVKVWDTGGGSLRFTVDTPPGPVGAIGWSQDSARLATGGIDGTARVWRVDERGARLVHAIGAHTEGGIWDLEFSPDGDRLMTGDVFVDAVKVWDISATGGADLATVPGASPNFYAVGFGDAGGAVWSADDDGSVTSWDLATGEARRTIGPPLGGSGPITAIDVSPDGGLVATGYPLRVWDVAGGELRFTVPGEVLWQAWSPDGELLAVAEQRPGGGRVVILDRAGEQVATLREEAGVGISSVAFDADGSHLVTTRQPPRPGPVGRAVRIWDWRAGDVVREIETPAVYAEFDPTGRTVLAVQQYDAVAEIWHAGTGEQLARYTGPTGPVQGAAFSPDGSRVAVSSVDGAIRLWDPETGTEELRLETSEPAFGVAFSPDGSRLASVSEGGAVRVWALDLDELIEVARERLTRDLLLEECREYLHVDRCPAS
jgi:WD40 repeat protein/DNA-binding SARP family transcriptional activator